MNYLLEIVTRCPHAQHTTATAFSNGTKPSIHVQLVSIDCGMMSDHLIQKLRESGRSRQ